MTVLKQKIIRQIEDFGPMSIADYMSICLLHSEHGYYRKADPLGASGDFITSPEISQMFGEMLGLWLAQSWQDQGSPNPFILTEMGPGHGTLMADILRVTKTIPGFHAGLKLQLIDVNPRLQDIQKAVLSDYNPEWVRQIEDLSPLPLFFVANEFFDCLPIRQFRRSDSGWQEQLVATKDGELGFALGPALPFETVTDLVTKPEQIVEVSSAAGSLSATIAQHIAQHGGCALIVDYGDWHPTGDTLQAVKAHKKVNPLAEPGASDLTAHVSFAALSEAASPFVRVSGMTPQGVFLERLGITGRAQRLADKLKGEALENHIAAHRRLTHPDEMGNLFKAIALTPKTSPPVPGLDP